MALNREHCVNRFVYISKWHDIWLSRKLWVAADYPESHFCDLSANLMLDRFAQPSNKPVSKLSLLTRSPRVCQMDTSKNRAAKLSQHATG